MTRPRLFGAAAVLLLLLVPQGAAAEESTCISCHKETHPEIVEAFQKDVHLEKGFSCQGCHGGDPTLGGDGDPEASMDPKKGYVGSPARKDIPAFCGKCHSNLEVMRRYNPSARVDQEAEYRTSAHGRRLAEGDENVATCIDCHGVHGISAVKSANGPVYPTQVAVTCGKCHSDEARMSPYGVKHTVVEDYRKSVHARALYEKKDLTAPTCNDCHGNHGAAPPEVESVSRVCGHCHVREADYFRKSPKKAAFDSRGFHECETCHGMHDIEQTSDVLLGTGARARCRGCHEGGPKMKAAADAMYASLTGLDARIREAHGLLEDAERQGVEVSQALYDLTQARSSLHEARVRVHAFNSAVVGEAVAEGTKIADASHERGVAALGEALYRRKGLAFAVVVIAITLLALWLKIREVDRSQQRETVGP